MCFFFMCSIISGRMVGWPQVISKKLVFFHIFRLSYGVFLVDFHGKWIFLVGFPRQFVVPPCWFGKPAASTGPLGPDGKPDCRGGRFGWLGVGALRCLELFLGPLKGEIPVEDGAGFWWFWRWKPGFWWFWRWKPGFWWFFLKWWTIFGVNFY